MSEKQNTCQSCQHFQNWECRRFPPVFVWWDNLNQYGDKYQETGFRYPDVAPDVPACGEYKISVTPVGYQS